MKKPNQKKVPHSKKMATSPPWPHIIWLLLSVCSDSGVLNLQPATSLHVNYDRAMCNVQCEIDCSKTVKIVAWVICSRMAELCTAQSCMANFILIHQTTVHCVVCYSNYNCAILWNAAPLSTMLQPKDKAETVIQHPTTFHFHFLTQDWSTSSNFLIIFHVHTFSDPIWCSDGKFFLFGQNVLLGKVVKQLQGLF